MSTAEFDALASEFEQSAHVAHTATVAILKTHAHKMGEEMARTAPSRRVARSVKVLDSRDGLTVGPHSPLGHLFEFGTIARYQKSGRYTGIMPPQPFVWPAVDRGMPGIMRDLARMRLL